MIRKAYYLEQDAREEAESYLEEGGYIEESSNNCEKYPCPNELDSWQGEINVYNVYDEDDNCIASIGYWCYSDKTYQVMFNDDNNSDSAGVDFATIEEAKAFIERYKGTSSFYFEDYKGGVVSIYCVETAETIYAESI